MQHLARFAVLCGFLTCLGPSALAAKPARAASGITLNFPQADVDGVARAMAAILGRDIVVDPRVTGKVTLYTDTPVSPAQAQAMFAAVLRGVGFALVESQGLLKVVPEAEARLQASMASDKPSPGRDVVETQVYRLAHENANNLVTVLRPLMSPNSTINVNAGNNSLVITDYRSNLQRLQTLVSALDVPSATDVEVMPLRHALATQMASIVQKLVDGATVSTVGGSGGAPGATASTGSAPAAGAGVSIVADPFRNALLVRAPNQARMASIRALVARLDEGGLEGVGGSNVHVVYLKYAEATRLAPVLRASFAAPTGRLASANASGEGASGGSAGGGDSGAASGGNASSGLPGKVSSGASSAAASPATAVGQPVTGGYIQADPASNALIITAPDALFAPMQAVIAQLDTPRAQIYVESLVVEVDASKSYDVGVKWKEIFNISTTDGLTLGTVASAVAALSGTNILSTANIVTLDNEEARIVVGQNVPFVTGSYTTTSSSASPFQTIERKDVGITLRIKPQISADGRIRMTIYQESSSVSSTTAAGTTNAGPTTNTRAIETHVLVRDGHLIVLGGLIQDSAQNEASVMPGMWRLPLIGGLFRADTSSRNKNNLVVFLRPHVMRDDAATDSMTLDRYAAIRATQQALPADPLKTLQDTDPKAEPPPSLPATP